jgi:hypothetical protein
MQLPGGSILTCDTETTVCITPEGKRVAANFGLPNLPLSVTTLRDGTIVWLGCKKMHYCCGETLCRKKDVPLEFGDEFASFVAGPNDNIWVIASENGATAGLIIDHETGHEMGQFGWTEPEGGFGEEGSGTTFDDVTLVRSPSCVERWIDGQSMIVANCSDVAELYDPAGIRIGAIQLPLPTVYILPLVGLASPTVALSCREMDKNGRMKYEFVAYDIALENVVFRQEFPKGLGPLSLLPDGSIAAFDTDGRVWRIDPRSWAVTPYCFGEHPFVVWNAGRSQAEVPEERTKN